MRQDELQLTPSGAQGSSSAPAASCPEATTSATRGSTRTDTSTCGHCKKTKPVSEFQRHRGRPSGLQPWCRDCQNRTNRAQSLAFQLAGGQDFYRQLDRKERMELRAVGYRLADAEFRFAKEAERIGRAEAGFVYVITNPAWSDLVKIGKACNPRQRVDGLNTADPFRAFRVAYKQFFDKAQQVESILHQRHAHRRVGGEWFRMTVGEAKAAIYQAWEAA